MTPLILQIKKRHSIWLSIRPLHEFATVYACIDSLAAPVFPQLGDSLDGLAV